MDSGWSGDAAGYPLSMSDGIENYFFYSNGDNSWLWFLFLLAWLLLALLLLLLHFLTKQKGVECPDEEEQKKEEKVKEEEEIEKSEDECVAERYDDVEVNYDDSQIDLVLPPGIIGRIWFAIEYMNEGFLRITLIKARHLVAPDNALIHSLARVQILPEHDFKQTLVHKGANPNYHEMLSFDVPAAELCRRFVKIQVMNAINPQVPYPIGSCYYALDDFYSAHSVAYGKVVWKDLRPDHTNSMILLKLGVRYDHKDKILLLLVSQIQALYTRQTARVYVQATLIWLGQPVVMKQGGYVTLNKGPENDVKTAVQPYQTKFSFILPEREEGKGVKLEEYSLFIEMKSDLKETEFVEQSDPTLATIILGIKGETDLIDLIDKPSDWFQAQ
ncbi:hypothetical protein SNEBB_002185 [Seison nebaliae]|nr:hypothetical protein SNEBB_002185 [Seison nebaliae]